MNPTLLSPFLDASPLLRPNPAELSYGCIMADLDKDGLPEIFVACVGAPNRLYKWADSRLQDVASGVVQDVHAAGIGVAAADFTGNGFPDLYIMNASTFLGPDSDPDRLLSNRGDLEFQDLLARCPGRNVAAGRSVCWFDPFGHGEYFAYVCNYAVPCRLFGHDTAGDLIDLAPELGLDQLTGGRVAVAADFFNTGRIDLFCGNENDRNRFFRNEGNGEIGRAHV